MINGHFLGCSLSGAFACDSTIVGVNCNLVNCLLTEGVTKILHRLERYRHFLFDDVTRIIQIVMRSDRPEVRGI